MRRKTRKRRNKIIVVMTFGFLLFLCVGYAAFSTNLNITAKGNIKEKNRVIQSWDGNIQTDFHSDFYKENIVSATFLDSANVPSGATESWNVSEDKTHGGVMAYVIPNNEDNTKYDLYIGAKDGVIANEDSSHLFYGFTSVKSISFKGNFDTSGAHNMSYMFTGCYDLAEIIGIESFDTSNVISMEDMFSYDKSLKSIDVSNFNTSNVTNMRAMFLGCISLNNINVSNFDTSNVTTMYGMFTSWPYGNGSLTTLNVSNFDTSKVQDMHALFEGHPNLTEIKGLENFDTSNVTDMSQMFAALPKIQQLNLCSFDTSRVTTMHSMFQQTTELGKIYVGSNWTSDGADTTNMFGGCLATSVTKGVC